MSVLHADVAVEVVGDHGVVAATLKRALGVQFVLVSAHDVTVWKLLERTLELCGGESGSLLVPQRCVIVISITGFAC